MAIQPTNAGINYQQRVSAQFLAVMLTCEDLNNWLSCGEGQLTSVCFESCNEIDDLVLKDNTNSTYYVQVKRTISLSSTPDTPFFKTIQQFVRQYINNPNHGKYYLAVSSQSSSQVNNTLRRLLNSLRSSGQIALSIPNQSDQKVLDTLLSCIKDAYCNETGNQIVDQALSQLCHRIFVEVYDIEQGLCQERVCKMLLASKFGKQSESIWNRLITDALEFATNRNTVTYDYLCALYANHTNISSVDSAFNSVLCGEVQIGYDVVLCKTGQLLEKITHNNNVFNQADSPPLSLLQLYRFDKKGKKQISLFQPDSSLIMPGNITLEVLHRCSSFVGMDRYIDRVQIDRANILPLLGDGDGQEDNFPSAQLHKKWITEQLKNSPGLHCIHCQESILGEPSYIIEVDNVSESPKVGYTHEGCLRPVDRVLGKPHCSIIEEYPLLRNFDYTAWLKPNVQRLFSQIQQMGLPLQTILWNNDIRTISEGRFCIKANLENGDSIYITQRGFVVRGSYSYIQSQVEKHNKLLQQNYSESDPVGFSSISHIYGTYSTVSKQLDIGESFVRCLDYECAPFTSTVNELFNSSGDYYAPLAYLAVDNSPVVFDGYIFLITNPLELDKFIDNWTKQIGFPSKYSYQVTTIENDSDFDYFVGDAISKELHIIVDPWFGDYHDLVRGCIIASFENYLSEGTSR